MKYFLASFLVTALALVLSVIWAGLPGLFVCVLLIVLEISFSFDNAVVNATVLKDMSGRWQRRFLTWGMLVTVFGMYYFSPLLIVSLATGLSLPDVAHMAIKAPGEYSHHLMTSHTQIAAFGGMFLLMVFFQFIFNESKEVHWLGRIERKLAWLGQLEALEIILALVLLLVLQSFLPEDERFHVLVAGTIGIVLHVTINSLTGLFGIEELGASAAPSGLLGFIYLNILDASFSLDAVVGSFAISSDIVIIVLGLSAGAMFVRSMTVYLVQKGTLDQYIYLEHGAHYAIGVLAVIMLVSIVMPVSQIVTGLIGVVFILLSFWSSVCYNRNMLQRSNKRLN